MQRCLRASRRQFLASTGATGAIALAGCLGDGGGGSTNGSPEEQGNDRLRAELGLAYPEYELEDELHIYQWTNYWDPTIVPEFEEAFGVSTTVEKYGSNEELRSNLTTKGYDVIFPSDWMVEILISEGQLRPLGLEKLPNWENLGQRWVDTAPYDRGEQRYSAPYLWGTTGIAWHRELVDGALADIDQQSSWDAMWDERFDDQIQMMDLPRETYAAALKTLGYSLNATDPDEIAEATDLLLQQQDLVTRYKGDQTADDLVNQRATPLHAFSGGALTAQTQLRENGDSPVEYHIPEEGGVVWIDTMAIPEGAPNPNAAHAFLNYLLHDLVGSWNAKYTRYATPNVAAQDHLDDEVLANGSIYPPQEVQEKLEFIESVGDAQQHYDDGWEQITQES